MPVPLHVKHSFLLISTCFFWSIGFAQSTIVKGVVTDGTDHRAIPLASITNIMNGKAVISDTSGDFAAIFSVGQMLAFSADGYYSDTCRISAEIINGGIMQISLSPIKTTLENVTVVGGSYNAYQLDSMARRRYFLKAVGSGKIPVVGRANDLGFGVALNIDHFGKSEKNKRKARTLFDIIEEGAYINYVWNKTIVEKYTHFGGEKLIKFMTNYRPKYNWLREHTSEEDILYYINSCLKN